MHKLTQDKIHTVILRLWSLSKAFGCQFLWMYVQVTRLSNKLKSKYHRTSFLLIFNPYLGYLKKNLSWMNVLLHADLESNSFLHLYPVHRL